MRLRGLELRDAPGMLEWLLEPDIYKYMRYDSKSMSISKAEDFIIFSKQSEENKHLAIVSDEDVYLGTVSLKNIDKNNEKAEFAIAIRKCAMGSGVSQKALIEMLRIAFEELKLHKVYLYVRADNERAIKFYKKCGIKEEGYFREHLKIGDTFYDIKWYSVLYNEYADMLKNL